MDQDKRMHLSDPLPMRLSMQSACPYIVGQTEQRIAVDVSLDPQVHDALARAGFRRVENWVYRPTCPNCTACTPWRVDAPAFRASRNLTRIRRINHDLQRRVTGPEVTPKHYELFKCYVTQRHEDGQMAMMGPEEFHNMIINSPIDTVLVNYHDGDDRLVATAIADIQSDGLSAVYSFFDPAQSRRSLGSFIILDLLEMTGEAGLRWLYLGYYIAGSSKMMYKARYKPAEIYRDGVWQPFDPERSF
jgi:arginyl-tRNA--protein-N-Asp/Glu arginylyltransferase